MKGRVPDEVDAEFVSNEEEILSCSPKNLAAVPNIKCESHIDSAQDRDRDIGVFVSMVLLAIPIIHLQPPLVVKILMRGR